jgi:hypothetical protein
MKFAAVTVRNELVGDVRISGVGYKYGFVCRYPHHVCPPQSSQGGQTEYHDLWCSSNSNNFGSASWDLIQGLQ